RSVLYECDLHHSIQRIPYYIAVTRAWSTISTLITTLIQRKPTILALRFVVAFVQNALYPEQFSSCQLEQGCRRSFVSKTAGSIVILVMCPNIGSLENRNRSQAVKETSTVKRDNTINFMNANPTADQPPVAERLDVQTTSWEVEENRNRSQAVKETSTFKRDNTVSFTEASPTADQPPLAKRSDVQTTSRESHHQPLSVIIIIDSMPSVFNTDAPPPYNHDLFESLIVKKRIKMDGEGTYCCLTTIIPRSFPSYTRWKRALRTRRSSGGELIKGNSLVGSTPTKRPTVLEKRQAVVSVDTRIWHEDKQVSRKGRQSTARHVFQGYNLWTREGRAQLSLLVTTSCTVAKSLFNLPWFVSTLHVVVRKGLLEEVGQRAYGTSDQASATYRVWSVFRVIQIQADSSVCSVENEAATTLVQRPSSVSGHIRSEGGDQRVAKNFRQVVQNRDVALVKLTVFQPTYIHIEQQSIRLFADNFCFAERSVLLTRSIQPHFNTRTVLCTFPHIVRIRSPPGAKDETPISLILELFSGAYPQPHPNLTVGIQIRLLPVRQNSIQIPFYRSQSGAATAEKLIPRKIGQKIGTLASPASSLDPIGRKSGLNSQS
ncbi:hypothetical protein CLF_105655, partial [Clonorchis sinensis]